MIILFLLAIVASILLMVGESYWEKDWPRETYPCLMWSLFFLLLWVSVI